MPEQITGIMHNSYEGLTCSIRALRLTCRHLCEPVLDKVVYLLSPCLIYVAYGQNDCQDTEPRERTKGRERSAAKIGAEQEAHHQVGLGETRAA